MIDISYKYAITMHYFWVSLLLIHILHVTQVWGDIGHRTVAYLDKVDLGDTRSIHPGSKTFYLNM
jgi:hypothetical protein